MNKRISEAAERDPLADLARELFRKGYTDSTLQEALNGESGFCPEPAKIKVMNYLRDLEKSGMIIK